MTIGKKILVKLVKSLSLTSKGSQVDSQKPLVIAKQGGGGRGAARGTYPTPHSKITRNLPFFGNFAAGM